MALDQVDGAHQDDTPGAGSLHDQFIAWLETGLPQCVDRQRCLVLAADPRVTTPSMLYFAHNL